MPNGVVEDAVYACDHGQYRHQDQKLKHHHKLKNRNENSAKNFCPHRFGERFRGVLLQLLALLDDILDKLLLLLGVLLIFKFPSSAYFQRAKSWMNQTDLPSYPLPVLLHRHGTVGVSASSPSSSAGKSASAHRCFNTPDCS